jgi:hypothetical protein
MIQRGRCSRFLFEAAKPIGVGRDLAANDLDRDLAAESGIPRAEYLAHAA